ncbi:MAG: divergent PAP2 family protein [Clostridiales bacterium]|nr:divergent PAP2 family protein [Clostridiales bacterium]
MSVDILGEFLENSILWTAILSWAAAQIIKVLIEFKRTKKINTALFISAGGMPSSHSSFVTAMTMSIGFKEGFNSSMFALSAVLSLIVMYDAAGVRRAAGHQAAAINMLFRTFEDQGIRLDKKLKELLGHTPFEVAAGAILGILIGAAAARAA